jgi:hypothetical protein
LTLSYYTLVTIEFIAAATDYFISNIYRIRRIARDREFNSQISLQVLDKYTRHEERCDRFSKVFIEKENEVINLVINDRYAREKSSAQLTRDSNLSRVIV